MSTFETKIKTALKEIDRFRTPECLDPTLIGSFAEDKLSGEEKQRAEEHLATCLYCLKQLNDMKELLHYRAHPAKLSPELSRRLRALYQTAEKKSGKGRAAESLVEKLKALVVFPARQWRYSAVSLATACVAILISLLIMRHDTPAGLVPHVDANSFVNVRALDDGGAVVNEVQGVVVNSKGLVASNLSQLVGASAIQITSRDGRTYRTSRVWKDEDKNLAVMKIDNDSLPSIPTADISEISIGQSVFLVTDRAGGKTDFKESLISDFKQVPGRRKSGSIHYIQLATLTANAARGAIVDRQGKLVGLLITQEKRISLAVPIADAERLAKEGKAVSLSDLKGVKFSAGALNLYLKGILARDEQRWDEATDLLRKAVELNPHLEGARLELAYAYYKKRLYALEAREYEEVLKVNPENTDALFGLASNLETRGEYEEAIKKYEKVLTLDREDADTYYQLGLAYLAQGNKEKAMWAYAGLKTLDPGYAEMLKRLSK
jgi:tetratricopeptide (TPR) repeat protein